MILVGRYNLNMGGLITVIVTMVWVGGNTFIARADLINIGKTHFWLSFVRINYYCCIQYDITVNVACIETSSKL